MKIASNVKNLPSYPLKKYVVARPFDGDLWFYGTWDETDKEKAKEVALAVDGVVLVDD